MARLSEHHEKLTDGVGRCSVPMWSCGAEAGFCDEPAYGKQTEQYLKSFKYLNPTFHAPAFASGLACPAHGGPAAPLPSGCKHCGTNGGHYCPNDIARD